MIKKITPQTFSQLSMRMHSAIKDNLNKIVIAVIVMTVFTVVTGIVTVVPALALTGVESFGASAFALLLSCAAIIISVMLTYGLFIMLGRFYCHERAVIGHLLWGIRDFRRLSGLAFLGFALLLVVVFALFFILMMIELPEIEDFVFLFILFATIICAIILFPWLLVFPVMYHNPDNCSLRWCLSKSRILLKGNKITLLFFMLRSCWIPAVLYAAVYVVIVMGFGGVVISTLLNNISIVFRYVLLVKVMMALNAFYYFITATGPDASVASSETADALALEVSPCESATDIPAQN